MNQPATTPIRRPFGTLSRAEERAELRRYQLVTVDARPRRFRWRSK